MSDDSDEDDKRWLNLYRADAQYNAIRETIHDAQESIEQALIGARQLDAESDLPNLLRLVQNIDRALRTLTPTHTIWSGWWATSRP